MSRLLQSLSTSDGHRTPTRLSSGPTSPTEEPFILQDASPDTTTWKNTVHVAADVFFVPTTTSTGVIEVMPEQISTAAQSTGNGQISELITPTVARKPEDFETNLQVLLANVSALATEETTNERPLILVVDECENNIVAAQQENLEGSQSETDTCSTTAGNSTQQASETDELENVVGISSEELESLLATLDGSHLNISQNHVARPQSNFTAIEKDKATGFSERALTGSSIEELVSQRVGNRTCHVIRNGEEQAHLAMVDPLTKHAYENLLLNLKKYITSQKNCALSLVGIESEADIADVVLQLGIQFAKKENLRVLLVDSNFTNKKLSNKLLETFEFGLCDILRNTIDYTDAVCGCHTPGLSFLPAGSGKFPEQPSVLQQLPELIQHWKSHFDLILLDAGGINEQASQAVVRWCDLSCFVLPMNLYTPDEVTTAVECLHHHGARLAGAILTNTTRTT